MANACRWEGDELCLTVRVQPRGGTNQVQGIDDGEIRIRLASPPVDGEANRALIKLLSSEFRVPQSQVTLVSGARGRRKRLTILAPRALPAWLPDEIASQRTGQSGR